MSSQMKRGRQDVFKAEVTVRVAECGRDLDAFLDEFTRATAREVLDEVEGRFLLGYQVVAPTTIEAEHRATNLVKAVALAGGYDNLVAVEDISVVRHP